MSMLYCLESVCESVLSQYMMCSITCPQSFSGQRCVAMNTSRDGCTHYQDPPSVTKVTQVRSCSLSVCDVVVVLVGGEGKRTTA